MALSRVPSHQFSVDSNITIPTGKKLNAVDAAGVYAPGQVLQMQNKIYTDVFTTTASATTRIVITNFYVDITPKFVNSKFIISAHISIGTSSTPEWSWFIDREINSNGVYTQLGTPAYDGNKMNGYHGGPEDSGANFYRELRSFSHTVSDTPNTLSNVRYQVCMQDRWSNYTAKYINRTSEDSNNGYITRGSSSITVWEIAQ